jgi:hypothetical protein
MHFSKCSICLCDCRLYMEKHIKGFSPYIFRHFSKCSICLCDCRFYMKKHTKGFSPYIFVTVLLVAQSVDFAYKTWENIWMFLLKMVRPIALFNYIFHTNTPCFGVKSTAPLWSLSGERRMNQFNSTIHFPTTLYYSLYGASTHTLDNNPLDFNVKHVYIFILNFRLLWYFGCWTNHL